MGKASDLHVRQLLRNNQSIVADKRMASGSDTLLTVGCERNIGRAGVAPVERPFRLAMTDDEEPRGCHFCDSQSSVDVLALPVGSSRSWSCRRELRGGGGVGRSSTSITRDYSEASHSNGSSARRPGDSRGSGMLLQLGSCSEQNPRPVLGAERTSEGR